MQRPVAHLAKCILCVTFVLVQTNSLIYASIDAFTVVCLKTSFPLGYDGASRLIGFRLFEGRIRKELVSGCSSETSGTDNTVTRFMAQMNGILSRLSESFQNQLKDLYRSSGGLNDNDV